MPARSAVATRPARLRARLRRGWPLTLRGGGAVVLGVGAIVLAHAVDVAELVYVGVLLLATVVVAWISLWFVHRYGEVSRSCAPDVAAVGHESVVTVHVSARSGLPGTLARWSDVLPEGIEGEAAGVVAAGSAGRMRLAYRIRAVRRGIREIGPFGLVVTDPFGLTRRRLWVGGTEPVTVTPAIVALPPLAEYPGEAGGSLHTATHQLGEGADNLIPRSYEPGDSMRRINWRASAHHDELMVRQEEQESTPEATVVLDRAATRWSADATLPGADPAFEVAVSAAVSASARLAREGYDVIVLDTEGMPLGAPVPAGDTVAVEQLGLDLATVVAGGADRLSLIPRFFSTTVAGPVVVITAHVSPGDIAALSPLVGHSALPILWAADTTADVFERARDAGWRVAPLTPDRDLADAWQLATDRGASRAGV